MLMLMLRSSFSLCGETDAIHTTLTLQVFNKKLQRSKFKFHFKFQFKFQLHYMYPMYYCAAENSANDYYRTATELEECSEFISIAGVVNR